MHYFDNSATTKVDGEIVNIMNKYHSELYYNPSSLHKFSLNVSQEIKGARDTIARCLGCNADELTFVSCGSEANNTAIFGALHGKKGNIVVSDGEHASVLNSVQTLGSKGYEIRKCSLYADGSIDIDSLLSKIDEETALVCAMLVNNETGAINDIATISKQVKAINRKTVIMCDGVQSVGKIPVNISSLGADLFTFSGHKIHASKGIACLYVKKGVSLNPLIYGGGQEKGMRSGTEYVAGIMGFAYAVQTATGKLSENNEKYHSFRSSILDVCQKIGEYKLICGSGAPAIMCIAFKGIKAQILQNLLEQDEIIIGLGSACNSKKGHSKVMDAVKLDNAFLDGVVRISFSKYTDKEDVDLLCGGLQKYINQLRGTK